MSIWICILSIFRSAQNLVFLSVSENTANWGVLEYVEFFILISYLFFLFQPSSISFSFPKLWVHLSFKTHDAFLSIA